MVGSSLRAWLRPDDLHCPGVDDAVGSGVSRVADKARADQRPTLAHLLFCSPQAAQAWIVGFTADRRISYAPNLPTKIHHPHSVLSTRNSWEIPYYGHEHPTPLNKDAA